MQGRSQSPQNKPLNFCEHLNAFKYVPGGSRGQCGMGKGDASCCLEGQ